MLLSDDALRARGPILAALRDVATRGGAAPLTDTDRAALAAFDRYLLRHDGAPDDGASGDETSSGDPHALAHALASPADREHVVQGLVVMALVDGTVDEGRIARALAYAKALGGRVDGVRDLAELGRGHLDWVRADAQRKNLKSITGGALHGPLDAWILPYRDKPDPALADRYRALGALPEGTLGRGFFDFYRMHGFAFPGERDGVNERFGTPHDSTHVLSGYDTSPGGELMVSTFTAGMHPREPMSGHILPVIMSWHLGLELVKFAGATTHALDPRAFWLAWSRGNATTTDTFDAAWDFWGAASRPLDALRREYGVPPLDPGLSGSTARPDGYKASA
jgi:hypothetical protein